MASRAESARRIIESAIAVHWFSRFTFVHRRVPAFADDKRDADTLREIAEVQASGRVDRALALIEDVIRAPIDGDTLRARYVAYWAWIEMRCPQRLRADGVRQSLARDIRQRIARNLEAA